jgi:hypothetical protein
MVWGERLMRYQPGMRAFSDGNGACVCDLLAVLVQ